MSFIEAKAFVQTLGLKNQREWQHYGRSGLRPADIPSRPSQVYGEEFEGMGIWLGQGTRSTMHKHLMHHGFRYRPRHAQTVHTDLLPIMGNDLLPHLEKTRPHILAIEQILLTPKLAAIRPHLAPGTLVYTHYVQEMIAPIRQQILAMGYTVRLYTGDDKSGLDDFLQGRVDILLASRPILIGIDGLQKVCHRLILLSLSWTGAEYEQLVGRAQRQARIQRFSALS